MNSFRKRTLIAGAIGSLATLALVAGLAIPMIAAAQDTTPTVPATPDATTAAPYGNRNGGWGESDALLATALGITEEELDAAKVAAGEAGITAAVEQGLLTEEQATLMRSHGIEGRAYGAVRGSDIDADALLADALGITVEELAAAQEQVFADRIAQAVADGDLTQEEADLQTAGHALRQYMGTRLGNAWDEGVAAAIEEGIVTQEQVDALGTGNGFGFGPMGRDEGMFGGRGGHSRLHDGMMRGMMGGMMDRMRGSMMGGMRGNMMGGMMGGMMDGLMNRMGEMGGRMHGMGQMDGSCGEDCVPQMDGSGHMFGGRGPRGQGSDLTPDTETTPEDSSNG